MTAKPRCLCPPIRSGRCDSYAFQCKGVFSCPAMAHKRMFFFQTLTSRRGSIFVLLLLLFGNGFRFRSVMITTRACGATCLTVLDLGPPGTIPLLVCWNDAAPLSFCALRVRRGHPRYVLALMRAGDPDGPRSGTDASVHRCRSAASHSVGFHVATGPDAMPCHLLESDVCFPMRCLSYNHVIVCYTSVTVTCYT